MEPKMIKKEAFTIMGTQTRINPMKADYTSLWGDFMNHQNKIAPVATENACYGFYFMTEDASSEDADFIACMPVADVKEVPEGLVMREIPEACYAVFECTMSTISQTWGYIYQEWLPKSKYEHDKDYDFEYFPSQETGGDAPVLIHIPVKE